MYAETETFQQLKWKQELFQNWNRNCNYFKTETWTKM